MSTRYEEDMISNKILRMFKEYVSAATQGKSGCTDLGANPEDVDELLNHLCFVVVGRRLFSDYRNNVSELDSPLKLYVEAIFYWHQVMRKLNALQAEYGDNYHIRKEVSTLLSFFQGGVANACSKKEKLIMVESKERSYLDIVYNPGKYFIEMLC